MIKVNTLLAQGVNEKVDTDRFSLVNVFHTISKEEIREKPIYIHMNIKLEREFSEKNLQIGIDLIAYRDDKRFVKELFSIDMDLDSKTENIEKISLNPFSKEINIIQQINDVAELEEGTYDFIIYRREENKKKILDVTQFVVN